MGNLGFYWKAFRQAYFKKAGPFYEPKDYPDLTGQRWLITGPTGGIGFACAEQLAKCNAELWLAGRSPAKLETAEKAIKKVNPKVQVHIMIIDLNDLTTIGPAVKKLHTETDHLNGIIHNAGMVSFDMKSKTKQGTETTVGVNNVGPCYLQDQLDPFIVNDPHGRIVWLSSVGHMMSPKNVFDEKLVKKPAQMPTYGMSKAISYVQAVQWNSEHPDSKVVSLAVHPGLIKSDLGRGAGKMSNKMYFMVADDAYWGAVTVLYAALSPRAYKGEYVIPYGRTGLVRPDVYETARDKNGAAIMAWLRNQYKI